MFMMLWNARSDNWCIVALGLETYFHLAKVASGTGKPIRLCYAELVKARL